MSPRSGTPLVSRPVVILGAPRSGTTMLFNALSAHPDLWSLYQESGPIVERFFPVRMSPGCSDVVEAPDIRGERAEALARAFFVGVGNVGDGHLALSARTEAMLRTPVGGAIARLPGASRLRLSTVLRRTGRTGKHPPIRLVEKTPENSFRIQMLERVFPDALFVHLTRDPRQSIASIHAGWTRAKEFRRFRLPQGYRLAGYGGGSWCFGLLPGWEELHGADVLDVAARQWAAYNRYCRRDLVQGPERVLRVCYEDLVADPAPVLEQVAQFAQLDARPLRRFRERLPVVNTRRAPDAGKWRGLGAALARVEHLYGEEAEVLGYVS